MKKTNRLVFIDDSGDPGFALTKGSSDFLVMAAIVIESPATAEKIAETIQGVVSLLKLGRNFEFKFHKMSKKHRVVFLEKIVSSDFFIDVVVIDKRDRSSIDNLYAHAVKLLLLNSKDVIEYSVIKIDGQINHILKNEIQKYAKAIFGTSVTVGFSRSNNRLIQLADVVAGSVRRSFDETKTDRTIYMLILKKKIRKMSHI